MGQFKTKGLIIAENHMKDYDKMVTILTPNGKIGCAAKNARKPTSALMAATQFLCFGDYFLYKGASSYHINSCETIEVFYNIRTDLNKLQYAAHIAKIIHDVTDENQNTYTILQLILNTLYMISQTDADLEWILAVCKLRLLCLLGYKPIIHNCAHCKEKENLVAFSIRDNGVKCEACSRQDCSCMHMSEATYRAIQYITLAPPKKLFSFQISEESTKELALIAKIYLNEKLEKEYILEKLF